MFENFIAVTVKKTEIDWQRFEMFCLREIKINMITNIPAPDHLCHLQCFFKDQRKNDRSEFEPDKMSSFQKTPASH